MAGRSASNSNPFSGLLDFVSEMNRISDHAHNLSSHTETEARSHVNAWIPSVDIAASGDRLIIHAALSGVDEQDIQVTYTAPNLTISGRRLLDDEEEEHFSYHTKELSWGQFRRSITLDKGVHSNDIEAEFHNGLLRVTVHRYARDEGPAHLSINKAQRER